METVRVGLLIKDAGRGLPGDKTVIITANGHVTFTYGHDHAAGMKFTLEQWNEIVNFVDGQLLQGFEQQQDKKAFCKCYG